VAVEAGGRTGGALSGAGFELECVTRRSIDETMPVEFNHIGVSNHFAMILIFKKLFLDLVLDCD